MAKVKFLKSQERFFHSIWKNPEKHFFIKYFISDFTRVFFAKTCDFYVVENMFSN